MNMTRRALTPRTGIIALIALAIAALVIILGVGLASAAPPPIPASTFINAGGPSVPGWLADSTASPSSDLVAGQTSFTAATTHAIDMSNSSVPAGTPASVFQTERYSVGSSLDYSVPATTATSTVRLYFAENYSGAQSVGARLMNVVINGVTVDKNLDVYSLVGGYTALVRTYTVASPGPISIDITNPDRTNSPHVMGLSVDPVTTAIAPTTAIDVGGSNVSGWLADGTSNPSSDLVAGQTTYTASTTHAINMSSATVPAGTPAAVFQTERYSVGSSLDYSVPATTATSTVRLYFAENYTGAQSVGARLMNVVINGVTVDTNLDVFSLVGGYTALVRTYTVASPGPISIDITNPDRTNSPHLMGLSVTPVAGAAANGPPPTTPTTTAPTAPPTTKATTAPPTTPVTTAPPTKATPTQGTTAGLGSALACPANSVQVSPGNVPGLSAGTNYCFAAGTYGNFSQAIPTGAGLYGQGTAVLDGGGSQTAGLYNNGSASNVMINGFTIRNYHYNCTSIECVSPAVVSFHSGNNITISDNTIGPDSTAAISWGAGAPVGTYTSGAYTYGVNNSLITHNLITHIGYSGTTVSGGTNDTVSYNEVTATDQFNVDTENDVAAVGKFAVDSGTIVIGNNIHDNTDTAIWFDVFDVDSTIKSNTVTNDRVGIFYEISCNAVIQDNTISDVGYADAESSAYGAAVRISSSGASTEEPCASFNPGNSMPGAASITISGNTLTDNHEGVTLIDGHTNPNGTPIRVNNVHVTGNSTSGDMTATGTDSDAWLAELGDTSGDNDTFSANTYQGNPSNTFFYYGGSRSWSGWQNAGFDTSGAACGKIGGGSC
jgi:parallel beta-helix repeat protein